MKKIVSERRRLQNNRNQANCISRKKQNIEEYEELKGKWKLKRDARKKEKAEYDKLRREEKKKDNEWVIKKNESTKKAFKKYRDKMNSLPDHLNKIKIGRRTEKSKLSMTNCLHKRRQIIESGTVSTEFLLNLKTNTKICILCRVDLHDKNRHLDHIKPISLGGFHSEDNLRFICKKCNLSRPKKHFKTDFHLS